MNLRFAVAIGALGLSSCLYASAQAPAGATGQCKDGSYSMAKSKSGACAGHKGVQNWYAEGGTTGKAGGRSTNAAAGSSTTGSSTAASRLDGAQNTGSTSPKQDRNTARSQAPGQDNGVSQGQAMSRGKDASPDQGPSRASSQRPTQSSSQAPGAISQPSRSSSVSRNSDPSRDTTPEQHAGGGLGQVWLNTSTKVYHCSGDRYYGKTKNGSYMSESDAVAKGARPDAGKPCPK